MISVNSHGLLGRQKLSEDELAKARLLQAVCNQYEGLVLKLELGGPPPKSAGQTNAFLYYEGGELVVYCSLYYEELCGMVHPEQRRKGTGTLLLAAAVEEYRRRSVSDFLDNL